MASSVSSKDGPARDEEFIAFLKLTDQRPQINPGTILGGLVGLGIGGALGAGVGGTLAGEPGAAIGAIIGGLLGGALGATGAARAGV